MYEEALALITPMGAPKFTWTEGEKFNFLTFLRHDPLNQNKSIFLCDCGKEYSANRYKVRHGGIKSCGCKKKTLIGDFQRDHGLSEAALYKAWGAIGTDLDHRNAVQEVVPEWRGEDGFLHFLRDMGAPPFDGAHVVRLDITKPFGPGNCEWARHNEAQWSTGKRKDNTSGIKGVYYNKQKNTWTASVSKEKKFYRKNFPHTPEGLLQAAAWVRMTREKLHGKFANDG